jgi:peptidoglycan/LPS O-acetylase OafA/YrhL
MDAFEELCLTALLDEPAQTPRTRSRAQAVALAIALLFVASAVVFAIIAAVSVGTSIADEAAWLARNPACSLIGGVPSIAEFPANSARKSARKKSLKPIASQSGSKRVLCGKALSSET